MKNNLSFSVVLFNSKTRIISLSRQLNDERFLTVDEIYSLLIQKQDLNGFKYSDLILDLSIISLKPQRQLKELNYFIEFGCDGAMVNPYFITNDTVYLTIEEINLVRQTKYIIKENKCFTFDLESLIFIEEILPVNIEGNKIKLSIALNYFSRRKEFKQLHFKENNFNINQVLASENYLLDSKSFTGKLYAYQKDGFSWLLYCCLNRLGGILADDMGLGKTIQIIALIAAIIEKGLMGQVLIVVPGTLIENWRREFLKFAPSLIPHVHHGNYRGGSYDFLKTQKIVITSYSMIINDQYLFTSISWGLTILDEASLIKNPDSKRRIAVNKLESDVRIVMTGTPVENSLIDLWSLVDYVYQGYLGTESDFKAKYVSNNLYADIESGNLQELRNDISFIMLRRKKEDVLDTLPVKIDIHQALQMNDIEAKEYYCKLDQVLISKSGNKNDINILMLITELRMFTTHPLLKSETELSNASLSDLKNKSFKFCRMLELVYEISVKKEKVLIFTEFLSMIDVIKRVIETEYNIQVFTIDGRVNIEERHSNIDSFSKLLGFSVMVINPRTGGMGLNITAANHVIHYTRQWNPALEQQASARSYRNGQKKAVNIYYLYYINSIEEVIDERLRIKLSLSNEVIAVTEANDMEVYLNDLLISRQN